MKHIKKCNEVLCESVSESVSVSVSQSVSQWVSQSVSQLVSLSVSQSVSQSMSEFGESITSQEELIALLWRQYFSPAITSVSAGSSSLSLSFPITFLEGTRLMTPVLGVLQLLLRLLSWLPELLMLRFCLPKSKRPERDWCQER